MGCNSSSQTYGCTSSAAFHRADKGIHDLSPGAAVELSGLTDAFFNGLTGVIVERSMTDPSCLCVQMALPPCQTISVKSEHVHMAPANSAASLLADASKKGASVECECAAAAALQKEFRPTDAQYHAFEVISGIAESAWAWICRMLPPGEDPKTFVPRDQGRKRAYEDSGFGMEKLLSSTTLIDAQYLIALGKAGGVMPRWQEIPGAARIDERNVWRLRFWHQRSELPVLVWSYCWYSARHPDPKGEQLQRVLPILEIMVAHAKSYGEHCTIGVLQDYGSFPQWPRTLEEKARFESGLKGELNLWYAHPYTIVLMFDVPASPSPEHTNRRLYGERGWCFTEKHLSTIVKYSYAFWKLSLFDAGRPYDYDSLRRQITGQRPVPVAPPDFEAAMRAGVESGELTFTAKADIDVVIRLYCRGFIHAFEKMTSKAFFGRYVYWWNLEWGMGQIDGLTKTISYVKEHCDLPEELTLFLSGNDFTEEGNAQLMEEDEEGKVRILLDD